MSTVGGILESKEIGLQIGVSGTHDNTELNSSGYLTLKVVDYDGADNPIYAEEGTWISEPVNLGDKFHDYDRVFADEIVAGVSSFAILTRVSDNGYEWSEWLPVAYDGAIQSETKQYIQVKINMFAGFASDTYVISDFDSDDQSNLFLSNEFIDTSNGLRLKRNYEFNMTKDSSWSENGSLHRKIVSRDDWLRIDSISVERMV